MFRMILRWRAVSKLYSNPYKCQRQDHKLAMLAVAEPSSSSTRGKTSRRPGWLQHRGSPKEIKDLENTNNYLKKEIRVSLSPEKLQAER